MELSDAEHERGFTWVRGDVKVQLLRGFHPFPKGAARRLPSNPAVSIASEVRHRVEIAFPEAPGSPRLWAANPACLMALKQVAFGRTRHDGEPAERDYHDVHLLMRYAAEEVHACYETAEYGVRSRVLRAADLLAGGGMESQAAARQLIQIHPYQTQRTAEAEVLRTAERFRRRLGGMPAKTS